MADATVSGAFELSAEQPIRSLGSIRDRGREADAALRRLGSTMDTTARKAETAWAAIDRTIDSHVRRIETRLDDLDLKLRRIGDVKAKPSIELRGFDRMNVQLSELEARLDRLSHSRATPSVSMGGGFGAGASGLAGAGGGDRGRLFSTLGGLGGALPWWAAALPLAPALIGGATSLVSSAGSAALGAGTVGLGGLGPLAVGGGLSAVAFKTAITGLQAITKAQAAYTLAVQNYGRASAQAATERRKLNAAEAANPAAAGAALQYQQFRSTARQAFAGARGQAYRGISGVLYNATRGLPALGADASLATSATSSAAISYSRFLTDPAQLAMVRQLTVAFSQDLPIAERTLENMTATLGHLAVAATPFFHEAILWTDRWSAGLARSSGDTERVQARMAGYVNSAKDWARLTGAAFRTIRDIFHSSAPAGDSMVVDLTRTLDHWDAWINRNPAKVQSFFQTARRDTSQIASTIVSAVRDIWQLLQQLEPIASRLVGALGFITGIGPGGIGLGGAALYGAYEGLRGGRGPSGAQLLGAVATGSAGPGLFRGGGGVVAGVAGGTIAASALSRASNLEVLRGRTSSGAFLMGPATEGPAGTIARRAGFGTAAETGLLGGLVMRSPAAAGAADALGAARGLGGAALRGAARFALPVLAITSLLQAAETRGNLGTKLSAGFSSAASLATLGLVSHRSAGTFGRGFLGGLEGLPLAPFTGGLSIVAGAMNAGAAPTGGSLSNPVTQAALSRIQQMAGSARTPQQLRAVQRLSRTTAGGLGAELAPSDARRLQAFLTSASVTAAHNAGMAAAGSWQTAFQTALDRGENPQRAVKTLVSGMAAQLHELGPQGSKAFLQSTAAWISQLEQENPRLRAPLERAMAQILKIANDGHKNILGVAKDTRDQIFEINGQILTGTAKVWPAIRDAMLNPASVAQEKLLGIFGQIQSEAVNALTQMGFSRSQARDIVTQTARGGGFAAGAATQVQTKAATGVTISPGAAFSPAGSPGTAGLRHHARGGRLEGRGLLDSVSLPDGSLAAPGEAWIANRHTMMALSSATLAKFGKTAWEIIRDETRPHSAPPRFMLGGALNQNTTRGYGGYSLPLPRSQMYPGSWSIDQGVDIPAPANTPEFAIGPGVIVGAGISGFGPNAPILRITSGPLRGQEVYYGHAGPNTVPVGAHVRAGQQITEVGPGIVGISSGPHIEFGFYPPGGMGSGSTMATVLRELMSGAGITGVGGGGAGGARMAGGASQIGRLRAPGVGVGGIPGVLADQASRSYAAGLRRRLNAGLGASVTGAGFTGGGSNTANQALGRRMMLAAGWGASEWPALLALWNQESGWNANAVNPSSGAYGIPQSLAHGHPYNLGDAPGQIAWGLNYIRQRYGSPSAAEGHERSHGWYQRGGRVEWAGWHARGGSFTTSGPTLFGAGEGGRREQVTVTPARTPTAHTGPRIQVIMEHVHLSSDPADIEHVAEQVAGKILTALEGSGVSGTDAALMGAGS